MIGHLFLVRCRPRQPPPTAASRWADQITELNRRVLISWCRSGTVKLVSKVPILPPRFSRARNRRVYSPGGSVKPVSYWNARRLNLRSGGLVQLGGDPVAHCGDQLAGLVADLPDEIELHAIPACPSSPN